MSKTLADAAREYRQRKASRIARMEAALVEIVTLLDPPKGERGQRIKQIAEEALGERRRYSRWNGVALP